MIPYLLAIAGGYLIGDSIKDTNLLKYGKGGKLNVIKEEKRLGVLPIDETHNYLKDKYKSFKKKNAEFDDLPNIYIRAGLPKITKDGTFDASMNYYTRKKEKGVSVFDARYSPNSDFIFVDFSNAASGSGSDINMTYSLSQFDIEEDGDYEKYDSKMYLLEGERIGYGSDGEYLLNRKTLKVIGVLNPNKVVPPKSFLKEYLGFNRYYGGDRFDKYPKYAKGGLIAPNGKTSNLTPEQYKLVRTHEFKAWFGDWENDPENASKVVDENGEPLVVYHYSNHDFNIFKSKGFIKTLAGQVKNYGVYFTKDDREFYLKNKGNYQYECFIKILNPFYNDNYRWSQIIDEKRLSFLKENSFDGIMTTGSVNEYVVLKSEQIKLADGNNTTFDANNPDIRFRKGGLPS